MIFEIKFMFCIVLDLSINDCLNIQIKLLKEFCY